MQNYESTCKNLISNTFFCLYTVLLYKCKDIYTFKKKYFLEKKILTFTFLSVNEK